MAGGLLMLLVPIAVIVGLAVWVRRSGGTRETGELSGLSAADGTRSRVSLLAEGIGYVGSILVLAGGAVAVGQRWDQFSDATRLAILAAAAVMFFVIGAFTRSSAEPALTRLTSVTWAISVAPFAGAIVVLSQMLDASDRTTFLVTATASTLYAVVLWALHRGAIQHAVMLAGVLVTAASIVNFSIHDARPWVYATTIWAIAVVWVALCWFRRIPPWWVGVSLGGLVALIAPSAMDNYPALYALGIGTAVVVMALSVLGRFTPGLAVGAVAMLGYVVGAVTHYFSGTIGVPLALAISGLAILVLGVVVARLLRHTAPGPHPRTGEARDVPPESRPKAA